MNTAGVLTISLIAANSIYSFQGFKRPVLFNRYAFAIDPILVEKQYDRMFTSGFLHVDKKHLFFNMLTLFLFSSALESVFTYLPYLSIYLGSLFGGNLLALYLHRNHGDYRAVGASGAVSGVVFAAIALHPGMELGLIMLSIYFPAWIYGLGYVLYSIYGIKSQKDNIGHDAHLGGGLMGTLIAVVYRPEILTTNQLTIALILVPTIVFLVIIAFKPHYLLIEKPFSKPKKMLTIEDRYNEKQVSKEQEINRLLDKINEVGYDNLSQTEQERLKHLTKE